jgi:hypothetical protein
LGYIFIQTCTDIRLLGYMFIQNISCHSIIFCQNMCRDAETSPRCQVLKEKFRETLALAFCTENLVFYE